MLGGGVVLGLDEAVFLLAVVFEAGPEELHVGAFEVAG